MAASYDDLIVRLRWIGRLGHVSGLPDLPMSGCCSALALAWLLSRAEVGLVTLKHRRLMRICCAATVSHMGDGVGARCTSWSVLP